jgi:EAL domain-containing protein (putative c-di-GMP-specific phosphodiesterase class I)/CHASE2 domain-containing sensor protein
MSAPSGSGKKRAARNDPRNRRLRILAWVTLVALLLGAIQFGQPLENILRESRNRLHPHSASGTIALVAIDDHSVRDIDDWPWPRRYQARLIEELERLGARSISYDIGFSMRSGPADDAAMAAAIARIPGKVTLPIRFDIEPATGQHLERLPLPALRQRSLLASIDVAFDWQGAVWRMAYARRHGDRVYPTLSSRLAGRGGGENESFPIDYSIDPRSVPLVSAAEILKGRVPAGNIAGKDVVIGTTSLQLGDLYYFPGRGRMPGVYLHILGAETLKAGRPIDIGWLIPLLVALEATLLLAWPRKLRYAALGAGAGAGALFALPIWLDAHAVYIDIVPALFVLVAPVCWMWSELRRSYKLGSGTNPVTGLPNLNALREKRGEGAVMVAARVHNYAEICAALPAEEEGKLAGQIARRLKVGAGRAAICQGDEGVFAWLEAGGDTGLGDRLDALHALFRSPVTVGEHQVDIAICFGVDRGDSRSTANRLGGALVAAEEAAAAGRRWKEYDPTKLKEAQWKLSLLSQLDTAIEAGDLWVAYQPKLDLRTGEVIGAEALARWTHPEKGEIGPVDFIPAAEQSGRIENLTAFVLAHAIRAAALLARRGYPLGISVNLSARLIESFDLLARVEALLERYGLPAERLTLEVTETAALTGGTGGMEVLLRLRALGVQISIDDYGTGLSTLEYLKKIPATEIKVDQSFVQSIHRSQSDKLMVHSTIQLAHSLGHKVVAEGVEDAQTLEALTYMGCDIAQGFHIGRPMTLRAFARSIMDQRKAAA